MRSSPLDAKIDLSPNPVMEPDLVSAKRHGITISGGAMGALRSASYQGEIVAIRDNYGFSAEIIVSAVRNGRQIVEAAVSGADIATAGFAVYQDAFDHPYTHLGLSRFQSFWDQTPYE